MQEMIQWLRNVEHLASEVYHQVADSFPEDESMVRMFQQLGEDEAWHYHVMGSAAEFMNARHLHTPAVSIDTKTSDRIHGYLQDMRKALTSKRSKEIIVRKMVELELSEWNALFIYVIQVLKEHSKTFHYPAAKMQHHIKDIEYFLEVEMGQPHLLGQIKELPRIWVENILVVDDDALITDIIVALLNREGNIDVAHDGKEALELLNTKFYKLIISDIDMPIIDGFDFYQQAIKLYPRLEHRFLFLSGLISKERLEFLKSHDLPFFHKPVGIHHLRKAALDILRQA